MSATFGMGFAMDKYFLDKDGKTEERFGGSNKKKDVHFPLCLAIKYEDNVPIDCPDFLLNASKGKVFVKTDTLLPEGSRVKLHFYIPPKTKLLAEFNGKITERQSGQSGTEGIFIKVQDFLHRDLKKLAEYLEEKRHLVDEEA
jgi:hypothetical protein